jgi:hypothetical protein
VRAGYSITTGGAIALAAATAKTILGIRAGTAFGLEWVMGEVSFDGVTAAAAPVLVEFCQVTYGTNPPGTASTAVTPVQTYGRTIAHGMTAAKNWTTVLQERLVDPYKGDFPWEWPITRRNDCNANEGFAIRCTAPAIVNVRAGIDVERV